MKTMMLVLAAALSPEAYAYLFEVAQNGNG